MNFSNDELAHLHNHATYMARICGENLNHIEAGHLGRENIAEKTAEIVQAQAMHQSIAATLLCEINAREDN